MGQRTFVPILALCLGTSLLTNTNTKYNGRTTCYKKLSTRFRQDFTCSDSSRHKTRKQHVSRSKDDSIRLTFSKTCVTA